MTVSYWHRICPTVTLDADLVVIGAGICGVAATLHLERRGLRVVLIDRGAVGSGASTRNAGFLMRGAADNYAAACDTHGPELAQVLWGWSEENLGILRSWGVEHLGSYRACPSCLIALDPGEKSELERSAALLARDGFDASLIDSGTDALWSSGRALLGLVNPHDAVVNPAELMKMLRGRIGSRVVEHAEVYAIERASEGVRVRAPGVDVNAQRALVCTNGYASGLLPELESVIVPQRGQMLTIDAPGVGLDHAYYANRGSEYIRMASEGIVAVGGCRLSGGACERTAMDAINPTVHTEIARFAASVLGGRHCIAARWSGIMGFTPDHLPVIGPVPGVGGSDGRVWFCGGFTGHGMSLGVRCALAVVNGMIDAVPSPFPLGRLLTRAE